MKPQNYMYYSRTLVHYTTEHTRYINDFTYMRRKPFFQETEANKHVPGFGDCWGKQTWLFYHFIEMAERSGQAFDRFLNSYKFDNEIGLSIRVREHYRIGFDHPKVTVTETFLSHILYLVIRSYVSATTNVS